MADTGSVSTRIFFGAVVVFFLALVGLGVYFFVGEREQIPPSQGQTQDTIIREDRAATEKTMSRELSLLDYKLDLGEEIIEGSVANGSERAFVNVHVGFALMNAKGEQVGTARDTTRAVEAGGTWRFRIALAPQKNVAEINPIELNGEQKGDVTLDSLGGE